MVLRKRSTHAALPEREAHWLKGFLQKADAEGSF